MSKQNNSKPIEHTTIDKFYHVPNAATTAALQEAREIENLETINMDNLEEFIDSL